LLHLLRAQLLNGGPQIRVDAALVLHRGGKRTENAIDFVRFHGASSQFWLR